jgi:hypothetical protein
MYPGKHVPYDIKQTLESAPIHFGYVFQGLHFLQGM